MTAEGKEGEEGKEGKEGVRAKRCEAVKGSCSGTTSGCLSVGMVKMEEND